MFQGGLGRLCLAAVPIVLLSTLGAQANADTVFMENGDRITGTITNLQDGSLSIETEYAGALTLPVEAIASFKTSAPANVKLEGSAPEQRQLRAVRETQAAALIESGEAVAIESIERIAPDMAALRESEGSQNGEVPGVSWSGSVEASATLRWGNTQQLNSTLIAEAERDADWQVITLRARAEYGEAQNEINNRRYLGEARWQVYPKDRFYWYLLGGAEHDGARALDLRLHSAIGVGYDFYKRERRTLSADVGIEYAYEEWSPFTVSERDDAKEQRRNQARSDLRSLRQPLLSGDPSRVFAAIRDGLDAIRILQDPLRNEDVRTEDRVSLRTGILFEQSFFEETVFSEELTLYPSINQFGEFRAVSTMSLSAPLSDSLDLRVTLESVYDSLAAEDSGEQWDNTLRTGLMYSF